MLECIMPLVHMTGLIKSNGKRPKFKIGNLEVGGNPGELPTVLIGSIFYERDKTVEDSAKGVFDKKRGKKLIERQCDLSEKTGNPHMVDVMGLTAEAMRNYIDFVADLTDAPLVVDSTSAEAKISSIEYSKEIGLIDRVVYNSITYYSKPEEIAAIKETGVKSAIVLASNPANAWPRGRVEVLEGKAEKEGLIDIAQNAGIQNILIDAVAIDVPGIGITAEAVQLINERFDYPAGAAPCNAVLEWKSVKELSDKARNINSASAAVILQMAGADFILYGPIRMSEVIFPAVAMTDAVIAYAMRKHGSKPGKQHPLYKIF
jgi:tetrahydromethanopterin S-methyltransferase subunit H